MTRDEFRKMAHELRVALVSNYMEQLEEMVAAYEVMTRLNEKLRAELKEVWEDLGKMTDDHRATYKWGCEWRDQYKKLAATSGHLVVDPPDEPEW